MRVCTWCGECLASANPLARYCSPRCWAAASREIAKPHKIEREKALEAAYEAFRAAHEDIVPKHNTAYFAACRPEEREAAIAAYRAQAFNLREAYNAACAAIRAAYVTAVRAARKEYQEGTFDRWIR